MRSIREFEKLHRFSVTGGMAHEATIFYRLSSLLSDKWKERHASVLELVRCCLSFCHGIKCSKGPRSSSQGHYIKSAPVDLIQSDSSFALAY